MCNSGKRTRVTQRGRFYNERGMTEGAYREKRNNKITLACHCVRTSFLTLSLSLSFALFVSILYLFFLFFPALLNSFLSYTNVPSSWLCFITFISFSLFFSVATALPSFFFLSLFFFFYSLFVLTSLYSSSSSSSFLKDYLFSSVLKLSTSSGYPPPLRLHIFRATLSLWCVNQRASL